ncbi:hypothetical protein Z962_p0041 (plasmid) [Clostridium botulinum C/D str. BKT12695]|nr:hypothetical protein Z962_p0041 [Clostridium botulinum C/D str. BKT12695]
MRTVSIAKSKKGKKYAKYIESVIEENLCTNISDAYHLLLNNYYINTFIRIYDGINGDIICTNGILKLFYKYILNRKELLIEGNKVFVSTSNHIKKIIEEHFIRKDTLENKDFLIEEAVYSSVYNQFRHGYLYEKINEIRVEARELVKLRKEEYIEQLYNSYKEEYIKKVILNGKIYKTKIDYHEYLRIPHMEENKVNLWAFELCIKELAYRFGYTSSEGRTKMKNNNQVLEKLQDLHKGNLKEIIEELQQNRKWTDNKIANELIIPTSSLKYIRKALQIKKIRNYRSQEGDLLNSSAEVVIDDFFHKHNIPHNRKLKIRYIDNEGKYRYIKPDWELYDGTIVEYFGYYGEQYKLRNEKKLDLYNKRRYRYIVLIPKDLNRLQEIFGKYIIE